MGPMCGETPNYLTEIKRTFDGIRMDYKPLCPMYVQPRPIFLGSLIQYYKPKSEQE